MHCVSWGLQYLTWRKTLKPLVITCLLSVFFIVAFVGESLHFLARCCPWLILQSVHAHVNMRVLTKQQPTHRNIAPHHKKTLQNGQCIISQLNSWMAKHNQAQNFCICFEMQIFKISKTPLSLFVFPIHAASLHPHLSASPLFVITFLHLYSLRLFEKTLLWLPPDFMPGNLFSVR